MPTWRFLFGPSEEQLQAECPGKTITLSYVNRPEALASSEDPTAVADAEAYFGPRGWVNDGEVIPP